VIQPSDGDRADGTTATSSRREVPDVAREALELQRLADEQGIAIRLIGSLAIAARSPRSRHLLSDLGRRPPRDIDLVAYSREERRVSALLTGRGYVLHPVVSHSREWGVKRLIYTHPQHAYKVDVFLDQLMMAHTVDFAGRLEHEAQTVPLADLLLSKLQIQRITDNDLIDLIVLLAEVDVGDAPDAIDRRRLEAVLGGDWGFWYGALESAFAEQPALPDEVRSVVADRLARLRSVIRDAPKTTRWRLRARVGTRAPWFEVVADIDI